MLFRSPAALRAPEGVEALPEPQHLIHPIRYALRPAGGHWGPGGPLASDRLTAYVDVILTITCLICRFPPTAHYYFYDNYFDLPGALLCGRVVDMLNKVPFVCWSANNQ